VPCIPEQELIEFAWRWEPFGTGDEWIFPEFGITPTQFYGRLLVILQRTPSLVTPTQQRRLTAFCHRKLGAAQDRTDLKTLGSRPTAGFANRTGR
jgi:hypothetical protein